VGFLDDICARVRQRVREREAVIPAEKVREQLGQAPPVRSFGRALTVPGQVSLIAELKKASPSKGLIREDFDVARLAGAYGRGGAAALSVLTETDYFLGCTDYLDAARDAVGLPVLAKDFFLTEYQILEARAHGADAFLLIVAALADEELRRFRRIGEQVGLTALVEVHNAEELKRAVGCGAEVVGINNRDLRTFTVDLATTEKLLPLVPTGVVTVAESGVHTSQDVARVAGAGVDAMLVGESLMRSEDVESATRSLVEAARLARGG
jgi:indole-3-glycerol phosphate synthase